MKSTLYPLMLYGSLVIAASSTPLCAASSDDYTIVERGPHHRVWQRVLQTDEGRTQTNTFTELQTGLHYWSNGDWVESREEILVTADGAAALQGQHQVHFGINANAAGVIQLTLPEGQVQSSHVLGLNFYDAEVDKTVWVALLTNSPGHLFPPNQVLYPGALQGRAACDLRYTYTKAGLEQDVIIRTALPDPAALGLNPATTWVQAVSEFVSGPEPVILSRTVIAGRVEDQEIQVGVMRFWKGKAFTLGQEEPQAAVARHWEVVDGRRLLVEAVRWSEIAEQVSQLPKLSANSGTPVNVAAWLPEAPRKSSAGNPMLLAKAGVSTQSGFVLDYAQLNSDTNFTFKRDMTYYCSGTVNLSSTTTIEGGAVVKFTNSATAKINITGTVDCKTGPYRAAEFTSKDDDTAGSVITGSTGNPTNYYGNSLNLSTSGGSLHDLRFSYAGSAVKLLFDSGTVNLAHIQFIRCQYPIDSTSHNRNSILVDNALFYSVSNVLKGAQRLLFEGRHLTVDQCDSFLNSPGSHPPDLCLTNCLLVALNGWGNFETISTNAVSTGTPTDFQTVGAASHYLADDTYRNVGTPNISASLLADLKTKTTFPPTEFTQTIDSDTCWTPQVQRDNDDLPDLGYHYDSLDYVVSGVIITNATLALANGVVVGTYGASTASGIQIEDGGALISEGSPAALNRIVRYNTVQEQATTNWSSSTVGTAVRINSSSASARFSFTHWSLLAANAYHFKHESAAATALQDCQIAGGIFYSYKADLAATNCLWERVNVILDDLHQTHTRSFYNNLFRGGILDLYTENPGWTLKDNLFDQPTITQNGTMVHSNNGYISGYSRLTPTNANDVVLTNRPVYLTGPLGKYYYKTNDGMLNLLIDAGSRTVETAGIPGYTTQTNHAPDTCTVDIGFHYRITGGNLTVDTNSTAQQLAQLLVPPGVTVANASYTGMVVARGTFTNGFAAGLPVDYGVILSSGDIGLAVGPNDIPYAGTNNDALNDTDLDSLVGGGSTADAAVLEFDIVSTNSFLLQFQYVFASEEYPEYIGDKNDPMAIFVSTNYVGTNWINTTNNNIALVPGTNQPVTVNTINGGYPPFGIPPSNPQYYVDNGDPQNTSCKAPTFNVQYDGMTVLLTAQIQVSANVTNHVKIAIEDYGDSVYDSAVFMKASSSCN